MLGLVLGDAPQSFVLWLNEWEKTTFIHPNIHSVLLHCIIDWDSFKPTL